MTFIKLGKKDQIYQKSSSNVSYKRSTWNARYTNDVNFFKKAKNKNFKKIDLPNFNKAVDDRFPKKYWYKIKEKPNDLENHTTLSF